MKVLIVVWGIFSTAGYIGKHILMIIFVFCYLWINVVNRLLNRVHHFNLPYFYGWRVQHQLWNDPVCFSCPPNTETSSVSAIAALQTVASYTLWQWSQWPSFIKTSVESDARVHVGSWNMLINMEAENSRPLNITQKRDVWKEITTAVCSVGVENWSLELMFKYFSYTSAIRFLSGLGCRL